MSLALSPMKQKLEQAFAVCVQVSNRRQDVSFSEVDYIP